MSTGEIEQRYSHILTLLQGQCLGESIEKLRSYLEGCDDYELRTRLEEVETSYSYMLQYMKQGVRDPERHRLYRKFIISCFEIADQARLRLLDSSAGSLYHNYRRNRRVHTTTVGLAEWLKTLEAFTDEVAVCNLMKPETDVLKTLLTRHEQLLQTIFMDTWTGGRWNHTEAADADAWLQSTLLREQDLCMLVSAVGLSLMEYPDSRKIAWLLRASAHSSRQVACRALVSLALVLHLHGERIALYPDLNAAIRLADEDGRLRKALTHIYLCLLQSHETDKVDRQMREDILPGMMKSAPFRNLTRPDEAMTDENDLNPEWEQAMEGELGEKIRQMNDLQQQGADIYISTFRQLKGYPFFREIGNWFKPWDTLQTDVVRTLGTTPEKTHAALWIALQSGYFCNSDKYSLCLLLEQMPGGGEKMMIQGLGHEELTDEEALASLRKAAGQPEVICRQYVHDLYRFFKLYPGRSDFRDIFKEPIVLHRIPCLREILGKPELLRRVADRLAGHGHTSEALEVYDELQALLPAPDAELLQKKGYCLQKEKRYQEACEAFLRADLLKPDHLWTLRHLATCYRLQGAYEKAVEYYKRVEAIQPENKTLLYNIGTCLTGQGRYEEALQYLFKLDYLESGGSPKTWRALGWCSFLCGKYEQAMKYCSKVLADKPEAIDYLNTGHIAWAAGNLPQAVSYYTKARALSEGGEVFRALFEKDRATLLSQGIAEADIPLVLDLADPVLSQADH